MFRETKENGRHRASHGRHRRQGLKKLISVH
jgi:hypothetical protein